VKIIVLGHFKERVSLSEALSQTSTNAMTVTLAEVIAAVKRLKSYFNARLGPEDALYTYHGETNHNGKLLVDLLTEHDLLAANTQFMKKRGKRWTFLDRCTRAKRQLDYILVRKKWRNSVLNAEPYHTFCTVGSDHRVVSMRVRLSLRVPKPIHKVRHDWKLFSASDELQKQYTVEVKNRFEVLEIEEDANERYQRFVEANRQAMESCVPEKEKKKCKSFLRYPEIVRAREMVETASKSVNATSDFKATQNLKEAKTLLYNTYDQLKEQEIKEKIHRVENLPDDSRYGEAWVVINEITGRKKTIEGQVADHEMLSNFSWMIDRSINYDVAYQILFFNCLSYLENISRKILCCKLRVCGNTGCQKKKQYSVSLPSSRMNRRK
ncbi:hypothetical protein CAPTEDRAFT_210164, partial [Capitella teleta]